MLFPGKYESQPFEPRTLANMAVMHLEIELRCLSSDLYKCSYISGVFLRMDFCSPFSETDLETVNSATRDSNKQHELRVFLAMFGMKY